MGVTPNVETSLVGVLRGLRFPMWVSEYVLVGVFPVYTINIASPKLKKR
jgi:hypothetical protein